MMKFYRKMAVLIFLLLLVLLICGCKAKLSAPETNMLTLQYELAADEELEPFYVSDTKIYAAVNKLEPPSMSAPSFGATTERFIVYDLGTEKEEIHYDLCEEGVYIYHAMPFEEGVIYAVYTPLAPGASLDESIQWDIKYISDKGTEILDSGYCKSVDRIPGFALIDGEVYYLYEDFYEDTGYGFGVSKAGLEHSKPVLKEKEYSLSESEFYSNGSDYVIHVDGKLLVGNAKGIYRKYDLPEKISAFGICSDYLFCCTTQDGNKWTARSVSLKTGEEHAAETQMPLYRISSMCGDELTCVGDGFSMHVLRPGKNFEIQQVEESMEIIETREYVRYYPYGDVETLAQLDETKFLRVTW
ncbi:hypothetical protein AALA22_09330 [Anaerovoracaceae bacterium 41-7]